VTTHNKEHRLHRISSGKPQSKGIIIIFSVDTIVILNAQFSSEKKKEINKQIMAHIQWGKKEHSIETVLGKPRC
jgi:hypothetical protein